MNSFRRSRVVDGEAFQSKSIGSGPVVVLLHGSPSPPDGLLPLAERLASDFRAVIPAFPGYGRTPPLAGDPSMDRVRAALERTLAALGVQEAALIGFSAGAYRAFELALSGTVRATRIVSLAGLASLEAEERPAYVQFAALVDSGADLREIAASRMTSESFRRRDPARAAEVSRWPEATTRSVLSAELRAFSTSADLRPRLAEIRVPVLARVGALDAAAPPSKSEDIVRHVSRGRLEVVPGVGHALLDEDLEDTVRSVRAFLLE